jgi:hypothetical protein
MFDHLLVGGYALTCVKVHRLGPVGLPRVTKVLDTFALTS